MKHPIMIALAAAAVTFSAAAASPNHCGESPYGWQVMTQQEKDAYQNKLDSMTSDNARTAFCQEHAQEMIERAKERGVLLPGMSKTQKATHR